MAITFFWRCEGTTLDGTHDYSAGDTTATASNSTISATAARLGTNGVLSPGAFLSNMQFSPASIIANYDNPAALVGSVGFSVYFVTAVQGNQLTLGFRASGASTNDAIAVETATSAEMTLVIRDDTGNVSRITTTAANMAAGTWYGVVARWDIANDKRAIEIYDAAGALIDSNEDLATDLSTYVPDSNVATVVLAYKVASNANDVYFDTFVISDTYDEVTAAMLDYTSYTQFTSIAWQQFYRRPNTLLRM